MKSHGFTLVELIVVVTILAILGTIGFISYNGYLVGVRDGNRLSQLQQLSSGIELYRAKNQLFLPDSSVPVKAGGNVIAYQGFLGQSQLDLLDYSKGGKDPKDGEYFTYYVTSDRKLYQLLGFLEDSTNQASAFINQTYAADYSNRFATTTGKKLGVLTDAGTNLPIQYLSLPSGIDLLTTTGSYTAYYSDKTNLTGTGQTLIGTLPNGSCKRIKETGLANLGSGVYSINPTGTGAFNVYCDMDTDGGGWTLLGIYSKSGLSYSSGSIGTPTDFLNQIGWKLSDSSINSMNSGTFKFQSLGGKNCQEYLYCKGWKFDYSGIGLANNKTTCSRYLTGTFISNSSWSNGYPISHWQARDVWLRDDGNGGTRWQTESGTTCTYTSWYNQSGDKATPDIMMWGK